METILLIERDPAKLVVLAMILRSLGYTVLEAGSRGDAWSACNDHGGAIHLAVLDNGSSNEFVARLRILCPRVRALVVSDKAPLELAGMPCECAFLQKPFRMDALANVIRELLDGPKKRAVSSVS